MNPSLQPLPAFLLTREWRDTPDGLELTFWVATEHGPARVIITGEEAVCFIARDERTQADAFNGERRELKLKSLEGEDVDGLYFSTQRNLRSTRDALRQRGTRLFESDIKPADRYLMERFITASLEIHGAPQSKEGYVQFSSPALRRSEFKPNLSYAALDIETSGLEGDLYSIAVTGNAGSTVFVVGEPETAPGDFPTQFCPDESALIKAFLSWIKTADPDLILGWNVVNFDLDFLQNKCTALKIPFTLGRANSLAAVLQPQSNTGIRVARVPGRVVLDGIDTLRAAFWLFESFELESVAQELLGRGKLINERADKVAEIQRLYAEDKAKLAAYNLEDCQLVVDIFDNKDLINFAIRRAQLTGLPMERQGGSVAAFDNLYLPRLHRRGRVAPDVVNVNTDGGSPGGYVMDSQPGLYDNVLVLDFKSLYPSIIRTFKIDPLGMFDPGDNPVPGFSEANFAREGAILPALIEELWRARDDAKRNRDAALSQAVKIIMNSFYGVLGANGCRFFDSRLTSSITRRGHQILQESSDFIQKRGYAVIYGDTDSLFVLLDSKCDEKECHETGTKLAKDINHWWRSRLQNEYELQSHLEMEFETHFLRFLMPTVRTGPGGSKKRYAGMVRGKNGEHELIFKGLESVRTDWTHLARNFQRELYRRIFLNEPYDDFVRDTLEALQTGQLDEQLIYRKRMRRPVDAYTTNVPPHVQAARKLDKPGRWIRYVITASGAEPVEDQIPQPDYEHYKDRQLAPAADGILYFLDTSFESITGAQMEIF